MRTPAGPRLLFVTSTRVGDAVLSCGLLSHLLDAKPGVRVTVACGPAAAGLFPAVPSLERVIVLEKKALSLHWLGLWSACAGRFWDTVVDLRNAPMTYVLAARRQYRMARSGHREHRVVRLARVLSLAGCPPAPKLWAADHDRAHAARLLPAGAPVLAVGPTANWIAKTWPAASFSELVARLTGPTGILPFARIAVFGHTDERPSVLPFIESIPVDRRIDLVGKLSLTEVVACLDRCAFYVGNDSGLMHMAAAVGLPTLGLFGPSDDRLYAPWGPLAAVCRTPQAYEEIFPPGFDPRATDTLMGTLTVDSVEAAAAALWRRVQGAAA